jgi:hypothetical protein
MNSRYKGNKTGNLTSTNLYPLRLLRHMHRDIKLYHNVQISPTKLTNLNYQQYLLAFAIWNI